MSDGRLFESYERYYNSFQRPPFAPIFRPSAEEFADPITYVAKIREEAEPFGVVKIVPPDVSVSFPEKET